MIANFIQIDGNNFLIVKLHVEIRGKFLCYAAISLVYKQSFVTFWHLCFNTKFIFVLILYLLYTYDKKV